MSEYSALPVPPMSIRFDQGAGTLSPEGPTLTRRMSDLEGLFRDSEAWAAAVADGDPIVYSVVSSPVPEIDRELPQSITTIQPGTTAGELWMTKGHQHPNHQGEIYLCISGHGGLLMFDGTETRWVDMTPGTIGYMPPGWAHRSINVGDEPYSFLAVYPGGAGHDYGWVLEHGMGQRVLAGADGLDFVNYVEG
ncbi:glucose-6-phosphate isomerase family protein [Glaciibacter psychrotolerans]|uniref:glucose-6-phosphate isomerase n=1 Tax=Glaciibacter psychrotolerans TaxID=670054 RepID=A0A7Z0J7R6_9MICO|nr:glucose-6-phosphate isomerase [Leifsonia psychrotolerans]